MKWIISIFILMVGLQAEVLKPYDTIKAGGNVIDIVISDDILTVSTAKGSIESYSMSSKEKIMSLEFPMIKDFMGDDIYP